MVRCFSSSSFTKKLIDILTINATIATDSTNDLVTVEQKMMFPFAASVLVLTGSETVHPKI